MDSGEEQLIFSSLIGLDIFFIATILYLVTYVPNGSVIGKVWVFATVITISLAVLLRIASNFVGHKLLKGISYLSLIVSVLSQLCIIFLLLSV